MYAPPVDVTATGCAAGAAAGALNCAWISAAVRAGAPPSSADVDLISAQTIETSVKDVSSSRTLSA